MTWTKLGDNFFDDPKLLKAGEDAANLHARALVYSNRHGTDGRVEPEYLPAITRKPDAEEQAARLVAVGKWEVHPDGGWTVRDFHRDQPSAEEVAAKREHIAAARSAAGRKGGVRSGTVRGEATKQNGSKPEATGKQTGEANAKPRPDPSRTNTPPTPPVGGAVVEGGPVGPAEAPAGPVAPGGSGGVAAPSETPRVDAMVAAGGLVRPNLHAAADLEAHLTKRRVTAELAAAWGKALATPEGVLACWPWADKVAAKGREDVAFLKGANMAQGQDPWDRLGDGFAAWRSLHDRRELAKRREAEERAKAPARPPPRKITPLSPEILAKLREDFPGIKLAEAAGGGASS